MTTFKVTVEILVEAESDQDAYYACQNAVENLVCGDIIDSSIKSIDELVD